MIKNKQYELRTPSQIASWYHSQMLRIPHGKQNPTKRYLTDDQILELFDGTIVVQEKVDGKMSWEGNASSLTIIEDMTGKHTVHEHVMQYTALPDDKQIWLDYITATYNFMQPGETIFKILPICPRVLDYAVLMLESPSIEMIYHILDPISKLVSHFGSDRIEGLVIKNYGKQRFGKWVNDEFEDELGG